VSIDESIRPALRSIYEEVMWLSQRPNVTPGRARGWYTHIMAESLKRRVRQFTGQVSQEAVTSSGGPLMLEHYLRIQTALSQLVERHRSSRLDAPDEFIDLVIEYERVHIVTRAENYAAMRAKGDYELAGIHLISWTDLPPQRRSELWSSMLKGKVANAAEYSSSRPFGAAVNCALGDANSGHHRA
jgi:hypothetical protein